MFFQGINGERILMKKVMAMIITTCIVILNNSVLTFGSTSSSNEKVFDTTKINLLSPGRMAWTGKD